MTSVWNTVEAFATSAYDKMPFGLDDVKTVLMPRQALLKKLDSLGTLSVPDV